MYVLEKDRCKRLLNELVVGAHVADGLELMMKAGIIRALFPELQALKDLGGDADNDGVGLMHKDVWQHTLQVVTSTPVDLVLRWAAIFHDVGKAPTRRLEDGTVTFHGHDAVGARALDRIQNRTGLFDDKTDGLTRRLVLNHMRAHCDVDHWTDGSCRRIVADMGGIVGFNLLCSLARADVTSKHASKRAASTARVDKLAKRVAEIRAQDARPRLPKNAMGMIIEISCAGPGPWAKGVKEDLERRMFEGELLADQPPEYYRDAWCYGDAWVKTINESAEKAAKGDDRR